MMRLPAWIYKDGKPNAKTGLLVSTAKEALLAYEDGYWSHRHTKEEFPGLFKEQIDSAIKEVEDNSVFERFKKKPKEDNPVETLSDNLIEKYEAETGKKAIWDKGFHTGKPTKEFKEWSKQNAN